MSKRNPLSHVADPIKACATLIRQASYRHRPHQVFSDFVEMSALSFSNAVDRHHFDAREERYLQIAGTYEKETLALFPQMLACLVDGLSAGPCDFLGQLFMGLDLGNAHTGQFFTPYDISLMMAQMTQGTITEADLAERGGFLTVSEPACGAGGMAIAFADALHAQGHNYQKCMHVTAQDLDATAVHMCYLQLALLHVPAIVLHGNSLAMEVRDYWLTPAHILGGWDRKLARRATTASPAASAPADSPLSEGLAPAPIPPADLSRARDTIVSTRASQLTLF